MFPHKSHITELGNSDNTGFDNQLSHSTDIAATRWESLRKDNPVRVPNREVTKKENLFLTVRLTICILWKKKITTFYPV